MISYNSRVMEITKISSAIDRLDNSDLKEVMAAISFPRIYSHYESFTAESLKHLINHIFSINPEIFKLKDKVMLFIFSLQNVQSKPENVIKRIQEVTPTYLTEKIKKDSIISNLVQSKPHQYLSIILDCFCFDENDDDYRKLKLTSGILASKYKARCDIAHGEEDLSSINIEDWKMVKEKTFEIFELLEKILDNYINNQEYLK